MTSATQALIEEARRFTDFVECALNPPAAAQTVTDLTAAPPCHLRAVDP